ncbi:hypothetical protein [Mastigocoleus sp. MO_188.B34]|uniref:hypothetical protein n=1 Tax=Mastigocoleus sp. MO_188.B34 TaxID=3036635 RepID=UPI002606F617|nr:hypothetical protein [Mastigocoleus sp. MO_188.B34]
MIEPFPKETGIGNNHGEIDFGDVAAFKKQLGHRGFLFLNSDLSSMLEITQPRNESSGSFLG